MFVSVRRILPQARYLRRRHDLAGATKRPSLGCANQLHRFSGNAASRAGVESDDRNWWHAILSAPKLSPKLEVLSAECATRPGTFRSGKSATFHFIRTSAAHVSRARSEETTDFRGRRCHRN